MTASFTYLLKMSLATSSCITKAEEEVEGAAKVDQESTLYVNIFNYFGKWAEDKDAAISFRDRRVLPAAAQDKRIELDFSGVETAPHSFLSALLATPILRLSRLLAAQSGLSIRSR